MSLLSKLAKGDSQLEELMHMSPTQATEAFVNSLGVGLSLTIITVIATQMVCARRSGSARPTPGDANSTAGQVSPADHLLACSNVLFLCVGMTAIMILVSNSLARAFAIGAAMALVRFRIKLNKQALGTAMLFGVITGMACGVSQPWIAWIVTLIYGGAILSITALSNLIDLRTRKTIVSPAGFVDVTREPRLEVVGAEVPAAPATVAVAVTTPPQAVQLPTASPPPFRGELKVSDLGLPLPPPGLDRGKRTHGAL